MEAVLFVPTAINFLGRFKHLLDLIDTSCGWHVQVKATRVKRPSTFRPYREVLGRTPGQVQWHSTWQSFQMLTNVFDLETFELPHWVRSTEPSTLGTEAKRMSQHPWGPSASGFPVPHLIVFPGCWGCWGCSGIFFSPGCWGCSCSFFFPCVFALLFQLFYVLGNKIFKQSRVCQGYQNGPDVPILCQEESCPLLS